MKYEYLISDNRGHELEVRQELPERGVTFPTVLMVPGFGNDLHEYGLFDEVSDTLVKNGFQTFRFSFSGVGKSSGKFSNTTMPLLVAEMAAVFTHLEKDRFVDVEKIGMLGHGFGGSLVIAGLPFPKVKSYLFTSVIAHPYDLISKLFKRQRSFRPEGTSELERPNGLKTYVGSQFWQSLTHYNLVGDVAQINAPALFIHGTKDQKVKGWEAQELYDAMPRKKRFHIVQHADHGYTGKFRPTLLQLTADWFNESLRGLS